MKIIQLTAENVKKLTAIEIRPDGNLVQITGKNAQGKTSVLDAIFWALTGGKNIQSKPIRNGAETARIELLLGNGETTELVVERTFTETNSYLSVKTVDGAKFPNPQEMLNTLLGRLTFDPLAFLRQDAKGQFEVLRGLVKLDIDPDEIDRLNASDFKSRTEINRDAKAKRAQAIGITVPENLPEAKVEEAELLDRIQAAADQNADIQRRASNRENARQKIIIDRQAVERMRQDAERILNEAAQIAKGAEQLEGELNAAGELPDTIDITGLRAELDQAKVANEGIAARERRAAVLAEAVKLEADAEALTKAMSDRTESKLSAIQKAEMPVAGISFGDGIVTFNGLPLDQASDAEQLTVSMAIAAALNPKLRVLRIRDGSLLDDDAMERLAAFATERDMQIWIERVDGSGTVGFVMEDGHVKGQELPPPEAPKTTGRAKQKAAA